MKRDRVTIRRASVAFAALALCACPALAQPSPQAVIEKTESLAYIADPAQSLAPLLRTIANLTEAKAGNTPQTLTLRGAAEQISLAEWLIGALDRPSAPATSSQTALPNGEAVLVWYAQSGPSTQGQSEVLNATRAIAGAQLMMPFPALKAAAIRGAAEQVAIAEWALRALDRASPAPQTARYSVPDSPRDPVTGRLSGPAGEVRIFYFQAVQPSSTFAAIMNAVRTMAGITLMMPVTSTRTIAARGTAAQMDLAESLIREFDKSVRWSPAEETGVKTVSFTAREDPGSPTPVLVRVYYLGGPVNVLQMGDIMNAARTKTGIVLIMPIDGYRVLVARGTGVQLDTAEQIIKEALANLPQ
jgi:hypothetical protein